MKGLDWSNERYARLHTRDTPAWMVLGWNTQNLWCQLMRKMDRAGVIPLDQDLMPHESIAALLPHAPALEVERSIELLIRKGWLIHDREKSWLIDPEFLERDEAVMSDRQRQKESRRKRRDRDKLSQNVMLESQDVTETSRPVTRRHDVSHGVTPSEPSEPSEPSVDQYGPSLADLGDRILTLTGKAQLSTGDMKLLSEGIDAGAVPEELIWAARMVTHEKLQPMRQPVAYLCNGPWDGMAGFERFCAEWPAEYFASKPEVAKAWWKTRSDRPQPMLLFDALERHKKSGGWADGFVPNPEKWIRGYCWNDPPPKSRGEKPKGPSKWKMDT